MLPNGNNNNVFLFASEDFSTKYPVFFFFASSFFLQQIIAVYLIFGVLTIKLDKHWKAEEKNIHTSSYFFDNKRFETRSVKVKSILQSIDRVILVSKLWWYICCVYSFYWMMSVILLLFFWLFLLLKLLVERWGEVQGNKNQLKERIIILVLSFSLCVKIL